MMDENRRSFLKKAGNAALGLGCGFPLLSAGCSAVNHDDPEDEGPSPNQWAMIVDIQKCLDPAVREACVSACKQEHNLPENTEPGRSEREIKWIWEEEYGHVFPDQTRWHTEAALKKKYEHNAAKEEALPVLVLCNHCTHPACVKVCPTAATWKRKVDGIVMMDMHRCIGCRYCVVACPYGSRSFNWFDVRRDTPTEYPERSRGVVEKCTFCTERIRTNREPACVEASAKVPGGEGALTFGKLGDPKIKEMLESNHTICRMIGLGTAPNVYYIV